MTGAPDAHRIEHRRLDGDLGRVDRVISLSAPPMTPAMPMGPLRVGDDQGVGRQLALDVVERLESSRPGCARRTTIVPSVTAAPSKVCVGLPSSSMT